MLHIIGMIFKCIGILLLAILAIVVLLVGTVLFAPIRYEAEGKTKGSIDTTEGRLQVSWLFSLFRIRVLYQNGKLRWQAKAGWKKFSSGQQQAKKEAVHVENKKEEQKETIASIEAKKQSSADAEPVSKESVPNKAAHSKTASQRAVAKKNVSKESAKERLFEKIKKQFEKIQYTVRKICAKIKVMQNKKEKLEDFLLDPLHRKALEKGKQELFHIFRILKPDFIQAFVRFGFEDPSVTGKMLAVLAVIYPFFEGNVHITPEFEEKICIGKAAVKGHIRLNHFAALGIRLLLSKEIRQTVKDGQRLWGSL